MPISPKRMEADLHLHTFFSDGTYSPEELVAHATRQELAAIALTDHDTIEGCARTAAACASAQISFVPGAELTADQNGTEVHILGYFLDTTNPVLLREMSKFQAVRQDRIREMVARLNGLGVSLRVETVFELANCRAPGRPHVARALVKFGHCHSVDEAFDRYLKKNRPAWVPKFKMSAPSAIDLIHSAGGVAVFAHPGLNGVDDQIPQMAEAGLDGLECFHSKHSGPTAAYYVNLASRYNLLVTGGSDCHGMSKGKPLIGSIRLPIRHLEELGERRKRYL